MNKKVIVFGVVVFVLTIVMALLVLGAEEKTKEQKLKDYVEANGKWTYNKDKTDEMGSKNHYIVTAINKDDGRTYTFVFNKEKIK